MNFITKNLGWILLLIFFIFMLFIISTNDSTVNTQTWTIISTTSWAEVQPVESLDELINMLDNEQITIQEEDISVDNQATITWSLLLDVPKDDTQQEKEKKWWFLSFLKGNKDQTKPDIIPEISWESTSSWSLNVKQEKKKIATDIKVLEDPSKNVTNKSEDTLSRGLSTYEKYMQSLPWNNITGEIDKIYTIWVKSLKLNNKYFNTNLWLLYSGDRVKQIGNENAFGCFEVNILHTQNLALVWENGYVCKKWLTEEESKKSTDISHVEKNQAALINITTHIGDQIIINESFVVVDNIPLESGDIIDQVSQTDLYSGCFLGLVRETDIISSRGKIITVCYRKIN